MRIALSILLGLGVTALLARSVRAHEDKTDPVCGMRVDPDVVPWKADYAGETYFFCMDEDRKTFLADPERYAGTLTLASARDRYELVLTTRPRAPVVGDTVKLVVRGFAVGDRMASPPLPPKELADVTAVVYLVDRTATPRPERYRLARVKGDEEEAYVLAKVAPSAGEWRVLIDARLDGAVRRGTFSIPIAPVGTASVHVAEPDRAHHEGLSMQAQHDVMKQIGRDWYALGDSIRSGHLDVAPLGRIEERAREVPRFALHKYPDALEEFRGLARTFIDEALPSFRRALESGDRARAERAFRDVDAVSCTRCHLKFRFGAVEDLSRFPDLRSLPRSR